MLSVWRMNDLPLLINLKNFDLIKFPRNLNSRGGRAIGVKLKSSGAFMKVLFAMIISTLSLSSFAADFHCYGDNDLRNPVEVFYVDGALSYNDDVIVDVKVSSEKAVGTSLIVKGTSIGLTLAAGESQIVTVVVNKEKNNGVLVVDTHTLNGDRSETTKLVTCE